MDGKWGANAAAKWLWIKLLMWCDIDTLTLVSVGCCWFRPLEMLLSLMLIIIYYMHFGFVISCRGSHGWYIIDVHFITSKNRHTEHDQFCCHIGWAWNKNFYYFFIKTSFSSFFFEEFTELILYSFYRSCSHSLSRPLEWNTNHGVPMLSKM